MKSVQIKNSINKRVGVSSDPVPTWLACTWLRTPCGKKSCAVCGVLADERVRLMTQGMHEEEMLDILDDLRESVADAFLLLADKIDLKRSSNRIYSTRSPHRFSIFRLLDSWHELLHDIFDEAEINASWWLESSDAADADWYTHVLLEYLYRLLSYRCSSKFSVRSKPTFGNIYAQSVVITASEIVAKCLHSLALLDSSEKGSLLRMSGRFDELHSKLLLL